VCHSCIKAYLITAERLTAANKSVLLLERGHGPTVATGADLTLPWDNQLTPIDVRGLSDGVAATDIWQSYICTDAPMMAACVDSAHWIRDCNVTIPNTRTT